MNRMSIGALGLGCGLVLCQVLVGCQGDEESDANGRCVATPDCNGGEMCMNGFCVPLALGESSDGGEDDGPADDGPNDSGPADDGPNDSGPADDGPSDSGPADDGPADSSPADSGPTESCMEGEFTCEVDEIVVCEDGDWQQYACNDLCLTQGYTSTGCSDGQCSCDGFADLDCANGVGAFCACLESTGESCSDEDFVAFYQQCFEGAAPEFACFADYVSNNQVDCAAAVEACL